MPWQEARDRFGSDKPDTRFGMELCDVSEVVKDLSLIHIYRFITEIRELSGL